jgi:predicted glycoside hydrolase/deacetylase ChbG (UPF0249 family)
MSDAAPVREVERIHAQITRSYQRVLDRMDPQSEHYDSEFMPHPSILGHINKFIQINEVKAVAAPDSPLDHLKKSGKMAALGFLSPREKAAVETDAS